MGELLKQLPIIKCYIDKKLLVDSVYFTTNIEDKMVRIGRTVLCDMILQKIIPQVL